MYTYNAKVLKIIDGDTIDVLIDVGFHINITHRLRVARVDAPELAGATHDAGVAVKEWLMDQILDEDVLIKTEKSDSFGRYIAEVQYRGVNVNDEMLELKLVTQYKR